MVSPGRKISCNGSKTEAANGSSLPWTPETSFSGTQGPPTTELLPWNRRSGLLSVSSAVLDLVTLIAVSVV